MRADWLRSDFSRACASFNQQLERFEAGLTRRLFLLENKMVNQEITQPGTTPRREPRSVSEAARKSLDRSFSRGKGPKYAVCGQVKDVNGALFDVTDVRLTGHGFDVYYGRPSSGRGQRGPGLQLIVTKALRDYWWDNRTKSDGSIYDLPAGRTTIKRARRWLHFNQIEARRLFFKERITDLATLPIRQFAAKHQVRREVAFAWRFRLIGKLARPLGWWRTPTTLEVLHSSMTLKVIAQKLGIGMSHASRLRRRAKEDSTS